MIKKVKSIIDEWDPIGLFPFAPKNEYLDESQTICKFFQREMSAKELALIIHQVFLNSFGKATFTKSMSECEAIADEILKTV